MATSAAGKKKDLQYSTWPCEAISHNFSDYHYGQWPYGHFRTSAITAQVLPFWAISKFVWN